MTWVSFVLAAEVFRFNMGVLSRMDYSHSMHLYWNWVLKHVLICSS